MKAVFLFLLFISSFYRLVAQNYVNTSEIQTIVEQRTIYLNGGARAAVGGKSRVIIPVNLPPGTVKWYYSFTTSSGESGSANLHLLTQLSALILDPSGLTKSALSNIEIPQGSTSIDVYLLDKNNADAFLNKVDNYEGSYRYYNDGYVTNTKQALVPVNFKSDNTIYIGLKNPSTLDGVNITIEVVAEINKQVYQDVWVSQSIDKLYLSCMDNFVMKSKEVERICECYKQEVTSAYSPSTYDILSATEKKHIYSSKIEECLKSTGNQAVLGQEKTLIETIELYRGQNITKDYEGQEQTIFKLISLGADDYNIYNSLGFCQLCLKKYEDAKKSLTIGLGKNPTDLFLLGNLANYYLLTDQYDQAIKIYLPNKNKKLLDKRKFKDAVSDDLKEFERLGIVNSNFNRLRRDLKID
ncbi:MAG: hypothetical protein R2800_09510 [Flavipsychrobacter sp.]